MKRFLLLTFFFLISGAFVALNQDFGKALALEEARSKPKATGAYDLPSQPIFNPSTVYFKNGRKLNCDYVWREGETVFVVVQGKRIAVGYSIDEIDRGRSHTGVRQPARYEEKKPIHRPAAEELYQISGMAVVVEQLSAAYLSGLSEQKNNIPPVLYRALCQAGLDSFDKNKIGTVILAKLEKSFDTALFRDVMEWLRSPLGRKITALENESAGPEGSRKMQRYARELQLSPPSRQRLDLEQRFDTATGSSDKAADILLLTAMGAAVGMDAVLPAENRLGAVRIRQQVDRQRPRITRLCRDMVRLGFFYTYQSLTDAELQEYLEFAESQAGTQYHEKTFAAFKETLANASVENAKRVVQVLKDAALKERI